MKLMLSGASVFVLVLFSHASLAPQSAVRASQTKTATEVYRNIQVLRSLPAEDLMRTMHLMRSSLGVRCDYCHDVDHYEADTKTTKTVTRRMIQMVMDLNAREFQGRPEVSCNSCHRGAERPSAVPPVTQGHFVDTTRTGEVVSTSSTASAREILSRYVEVSGGKTAIESLRERVSEGIFLASTLVAGVNGRPTVVNRGKSEPVLVRVTAGREVHLRAGTDPDVLTLDVKNGAGVARRQSVERQLTANELDALTAKLDPQRPLRLLERAPTMRVLEPDEVEGRRMDVVEHHLADGRLEDLYFDVERGLLRRSIVLSPTPVGADPEQVDFEDYRTIESVAVPFIITTSYIDDNHYGTTLRFTRVQDVR